jgi:hypothetical protein
MLVRFSNHESIRAMDALHHKTVIGRVSSSRMAAELTALFAGALVVVMLCAKPIHAQGESQPNSIATLQDSQPPADVASPVTDPPDASSDDPVQAMFPHFRDTRYWLSGQANFIFQTHPSFHALYSGTNSLSPKYEKATSRVLTLYTGVRLNESTELLVDIEEAGGAALSTGHAQPRDHRQSD